MATTNGVGSSFDYSALNAKATTSKSATEEQGDRFMKLLVKQLQSQDPMNPMDNAQFTSQMAQVNTVTGIEKLNTTMASLLSAYGTTQSMQAASLIGKQVLADGKVMEYSGSGDAQGGFVTVPAGVNTVQVRITSSTGELVDQIQMTVSGKGELPLTWDGKNGDGVQMPKGSYMITAAGADADGKVVALDTKTWQQATSVMFDASGPKVLLASGEKVDFSKITQVK
ncbi:Basal-body rod modification protein FlgD [Andreprevotia sp. IGB-42]|uniref:flagellar hook assembly protein FlgD n=1 Tax=Andreprevotia sp. IGB-42 TaxID=2497473 RepID=UPI0013598D94|nr:flagellar hook capping FlgD N-terminal domain-containing protein [Andreprevotia sp. IGB-42]KAF0812513.1 Basal-body rod modification protein FlgD [Andreprevotia sp. IGB-42]